jgi:hypothetical protein
VKKGDAIGLAARQYKELTLTIYPGKSNYMTSLYEDDGITTGYLNGRYTKTNISYYYNSTSKGFSIKIEKTPVKPYMEFPEFRKYTIKIVNYFPLSVTVANTLIPYGVYGGENTWRFEGKSMTTLIETGFVSTKEDFTIDTKGAHFDYSILNGYSGYFRRANKAKMLLDDAGITPGQNTVTGGYLMRLSSMAEDLDYVLQKDPKAFMELLLTVPTLYTNAVKEIQMIKPTANTLIHLKHRRSGIPNAETLNAESEYDLLNDALFMRWSYAMQLLWSVN